MKTTLSLFLLLCFQLCLPFSAHASIKEWCSEINRSIKLLQWVSLPPCNESIWRFETKSVSGTPLVYAVFGNEASTNTTLVFAMVHSDEITPLYLALRLTDWLKDHPKEVSTAKVIVAPLINPDSFFTEPKKRVNKNGVDLNRNLPTPDWDKDAIRLWKTQYGSDPRRFPGQKPNSEPETQFQLALIEKFHPKKILSIHAPLNYLDYDGPDDALQLNDFPKRYVQRSAELRKALKAQSHGYFPGSLGNYAGQSMGVPTFTLELPTANPRKAGTYWRLFERGIRQMISFDLSDPAPKP